MWRRNARLRLMPPLPWTRNRLAAPLLVFIFGITATPFWMTPGGRNLRRFETTTSLVLRARCLGPKLLVHGLFLRRQHHDHLSTFELGKLLDHTVRIQIGPHPLQQL